MYRLIVYSILSFLQIFEPVLSLILIATTDFEYLFIYFYLKHRIRIVIDVDFVN